MKDISPKLIKLLGMAMELHEKQGEILAEVNDLLGGGAGIGAKLKRLYASFGEVWAQGYAGQVYVFNFTKDAPAMKRLVKTMSVEELEARMATFIACREEFIVRARHSFPMFVATINQHAGIPVAEIDPLEADARATQQRRRDVIG